MDCSIKTISDFYHTPLGEIVSKSIAKKVSLFLEPSVHNQTILGVGYTHPYIEKTILDNNCVLSFMPDTIGACVWPSSHDCKVALVHDWLLPLPSQSIDYICVIHALEYVHQADPFFHELWRILKKDGKLLIVVPNRRGVWCRFEHTPFGFGRPYTMTQAQQLLSNYGFITTKKQRILYFPPFQNATLISLCTIIEKIAPFWLHNFSGLNVLTAEKKTLILSASSFLHAQKDQKTYPLLTPSGARGNHSDSV